MDANQFRIVLLGCAIPTAIQPLFWRLPLDDGAPRRNLVEEYLRAAPRWRMLIVSLTSFCVTAGYIVGFVGMLLLWGAAPTVFAFALLSSILSDTLCPVHNPQNRWERFCVSLEYTFGGFIVALALLGPARHLFIP